MKNKLSALWQRGSLIGADGLLSPVLERVVVVNQFVLIALVLTVSYQLLYLGTAFWQMMPIILVHAVSVLVYAGALLCNARGHYLAGTVLTLCCPLFIQIPGITFLIGSASFMHLFLLTSGVLCFLVFSDAQRLWRYFFLMTSVLIYFLLDANFPSELASIRLPPEQLKMMSILNTIGFIFLLYILSKLFHGQLITQAERIEQQSLALGLLANTDSLTQLPNRRRIISDTQESSLFTGVVAIADIDLFKAFNDKYGHACGDDILRAVANVMQSSLRSGDKVGRWGGEEFVFLLSNTTMSEAAHLLERVRQRVAESDIECDGEIYRITISIGMAEMAGRRGFEQVLKMADQALYRGKQQGRNRIVAESAEV